MKIGRDELAAQLAGPDAPLLIDVLPEEDHDAEHLPGAKNACVFNVTFLDEVGKLAADHAAALIVYGSSAQDRASATAAEKLVAAGYTRVLDYRGGLEDWRAGGGNLEGKGNPTQGSAERDGLFEIDLEKSRIHWTGRNLTGAHHGTARLRNGQIEIRSGRPAQGTLVIDMASIENEDIGDSTMRRLLIDHLKSDDFFDVQRFPMAEFKLTGSSSIPDAKPGNPNCLVSGEMTIKAVSRPIEFPAIVAPTADGVLAADAHFDIDRTQWNVLYGSGRFYERLGKHLVNDEISLGLKLVTRRPGA